VPYLYNAVKPRATHNVMIFHPSDGDPFATLLQAARERRGLRQEDVADALGVSRTLITKWEAGLRKRPVTAADVTKLKKLFPDVPVLAWLSALGFPISDDAELEEDSVVVARAYQDAVDGQRLAVRGALLLPPEHPPAPGGTSLRRHRAMGLRDRRETQE
jgi:transcriptional regulator with XRE-family HTH domain